MHRGRNLVTVDVGAVRRTQVFQKVSSGRFKEAAMLGRDGALVYHQVAAGVSADDP